MDSPAGPVVKWGEKCGQLPAWEHLWVMVLLLLSYQLPNSPLP